MPKRTPYEVRKEILNLLLKENTLTYTKLQTKLSTNYDSIKNNCKELESYDFIKIKKGEKHEKNGKPFYDVELTAKGRDVAHKFRNR